MAQQRQPLTLRQFLDAYNAPDFHSLYKVPVPGDPTRPIQKEHGKNTTNKKYPISTVDSIALWELSDADIAPYRAMLDTPYDIPAVARAAVAQRLQLAGIPYIPAPAQPPVAGNARPHAQATSSSALLPGQLSGVNRGAGAAHANEQLEDGGGVDLGDEADGDDALSDPEGGSDGSHSTERGDPSVSGHDGSNHSSEGSEQGSDADPFRLVENLSVGYYGSDADGDGDDLGDVPDSDDNSSDDALSDTDSDSDSAFAFHFVEAPPYVPPPLPVSYQEQQAAVAQLVRELEPLSGVVDHYATPFRHEDHLTSRMDGSVLPDLIRVQQWIAHKASTTPDWLPAGHTLLISECGTAARMNGRFRPDRCAIHWQQEGKLDEPSWCPGDIKPSYKFHSYWRDINMASRRRGNALTTEYKKVMAQLKFYMEQCSFVTDPRGRSQGARFGYIITDQEVILVRRHPSDPTLMEATNGFLWRGNPQDRWSGMFALNVIHWLAANSNSNTLRVLA